MEKDDRYTRITLRIPRDLHERLSDVADSTSKSMNAEIIGRLEESFAPQSGAPPSVGELIDRLIQLSDAAGRSVQITLGDAESDADEEKHDG